MYVYQGTVTCIEGNLIYLSDVLMYLETDGESDGSPDDIIINVTCIHLMRIDIMNSKSVYSEEENG